VLTGAQLAINHTPFETKGAMNKESLKRELMPTINLPGIASKVSNRLTSKEPFAHCLLVLLFFSLLFTLFFSPALLRGLLLAPGDGVPLFLPNFYSPKVLWDSLLFGGFPMVGDPQVMQWYPPALLFSLIPGSWNVFIISAYVLASSFTYGYVYTLTGSGLSAFVSGIVYGMSGFMMAHLGHTVIIHTVAWIPLILWSLEKLRHTWSPGWFVAGSLGLAFSFFGGHSQMFFYALMLALSYAAVLGWVAPVGRWRYYRFVSLMVILGVGLAAVQIIPTAELAGQSVRTEFSFADFISYALPPKQLLTLIFPALFGLSNHPTRIYFGDWNLTELTGYIGLLPLFLASLAVIVRRRERLTIFWLSAGLFALLLTLGNTTPLATLFYHLPIINHFRAPARHFVEFGFAVSVLSGLGVASILRGQATRRLILRTVFAGSLVVLACLTGILIFSKSLIELAREKGVAQISFLPWENASVLVPLVVLLIAAAMLLYWHKQPASRLRGALLLSVLIIDLGSFGWFYEWQYASPDKSELSPPVAARYYKTILNTENQRLLPVRGVHGTKNEFPPNISRLWGIPSATGNNVLRLARTSHLLSLSEGGDVDSFWKEADDRSVDLMAIRYVVLPSSEASTDTNGVSWLKEDMGLWLGTGCDRHPGDSVKFNLPTPVRATTIGIVSRLACAVAVPDQSEVLRVSVTDIDGGAYTKSLVAGRDTSEWSYDCRSIKSQMQHGRATIFNDYPTQMYDDPCTGHQYVAMLKLDSLKEIKSVELHWAGTAGVAIVEKLSLIDEQAKTSSPIDLALLDSNRWHYTGTAEGESRVLENLRAMPRVWLATEAVKVAPEEALKIIKSSRMPDGRTFDPLQIALIEEPLALAEKNPDPTASARVYTLTADEMDVQTHSTSPSFLVTSDAYYSGWNATLDGEPVPIYRADYAIRGVSVPGGDHTIRFEFRPKSFYYGLAVSLVSLLGLILSVAIPRLKQRVG
jgi:hypothetical protein